MAGLVRRSCRRHIAACISVASSPCTAAARGFADAAPATQDDLVLETFKESQKSYRDFIAGMEGIEIPLDGDDAAIRKYASQVEALKQKVGMPSIEDVVSAGLDHKFATAGLQPAGVSGKEHPRAFLRAVGMPSIEDVISAGLDHKSARAVSGPAGVGMPSIEDVISAGLDHKFAMAGYNARKYLSLAQEGVELGSYKGVVDQLGKVVDEIESSTGAPLDPNNKEGWSQLQSRVEAIEKSNGLADYDKLKDTALFNMYKDQLSKFKQDAVDAMDNVKRRDHLESINVDPKTLSLKGTKL